MEAVILAGGKGTRLRPYTTVLPKPLMPVGERPILEIVIAQLRTAGVRKITIAVNHMAEIIMAFLGNGKKYGIEICYSIEEKPLGTVGPLKLIETLPDNFLVMNGDILTDLNFAELYGAHLLSGAPLTIAAYQRDAVIDFGVLDIDKTSNRLKGFKEKPVYHFDVSMGVYVFNRLLLEHVKSGIPYGFDQLVKDMLEQGLIINTYPFKGYWLDIGRPDDYDQANEDVKSHKFFLGGQIDGMENSSN